MSNKRGKKNSKPIPIDLSNPDVWDDTELIKEYEESMKLYKQAHDNPSHFFEEEQEEELEEVLLEEDEEEEDIMAEEYGRQKKRAKPAEDNTYANQDWSQWYNSYNPYSYDQSSSSHMPPPPPPIPMMNPFGDMSGTLWSYYYYGYAMGQYQALQMLSKRQKK